MGREISIRPPFYCMNKKQKFVYMVWQLFKKHTLNKLEMEDNLMLSYAAYIKF